MTILSNVWTNPDGLSVKFGTEEAVVGHGGEYEDMVGHAVVASFAIPFGDFKSTDTIIDYDLVIPKSSRIERVVVIAETAVTAAGAATIDIGLVNASDKTTMLSATGLVAALAKASLTPVGARNTLDIGVTSVGALVGTNLTQDGLVTCKVNTGPLTAGVVLVEVYYYLTSSGE